VVLRNMRKRWYLAVIEPHAERPRRSVHPLRSRGNGSTSDLIALPKGTIDPGENPEQTAQREVHEETGVRGDLVAKLTDTKYFYVRNWGDRARVFKVVSFYLFLYRSGRMGNISQEMRVEVQRAFWLPLEDAPERLSYKGEREVVKLALEYVKAHPELGEHAANPPR
jgi:8-oxo-dGTP pyrophosphatase MutT (NUDIX family)